MTDEPVTHGRVFWASAVAGGALLVYGFHGVFRDAERTHPDSFLPWFIGSAVVHDLVVAPVVIGIGAVVARTVRGRRRPLLTVWLLVVATLAVYALPFLLGYGRRPTNPSALPNDYWWGLGVTVGAVTAGTLLAAAARARLRR